MKVLVVGGAGFIGRSLCRMLDDRGHEVTAGSRVPDGERLPEGVGTLSVDVTDPDLTAVTAGYDAVVNLVALPSHRQPRRQSHAAVHGDGTAHLVRACERTGVDRFVQLSGLGVDTAVETAYFEAKRRGERLVRESDLDWVIYRPSVVFGDECAIIPFIESIVPPFVAFLPGGGRMRIQPLWVRDLTPMLADGVEDARHVGEVYELGGPEALTLAETVRLICGSTAVIPVPMALAAGAFTLAEYLPGIPFGQDQYRVLDLDNTTTENDVTAFGVDECDLTTLASYLERKRSRG